MVSGHVDGLADIIAIKDEGEARRFTLRRAPGPLGRVSIRAQGVGGGSMARRG